MSERPLACSGSARGKSLVASATRPPAAARASLCAAEGLSPNAARIFYACGKRRKWSLLLLLGLLALSRPGLAEKLTVERFLQGGMNDYHLKNHDEIVRYLGEAPASTPYLNRVELRTETDDFDLLKQRYALRAYPKGWGETSRTRAYLETARQTVHLQHEALLGQVLKKRYEMVLDYVESQALLQIYQQLLQIYRDRVTVLQKQSAGDLTLDVTTLIAAEDQVIDLQLEIIKWQDQQTSVSHKIQMLTDTSAVVSFSEQTMLDVVAIGRVVASLPESPAVTNPYLKVQQLKGELAESRYQLEVAKGRDYLSFVSLEFDTDHRDHLRQAFSVGFAFKLPFFNPDQEGLNRRKLAQISEKLKYQEQQQGVTERTLSLRRSLQRFIEQHQLLHARKAQDTAEASFSRYQRLEGINPLTLLKLKESMLRDEIRLTHLTQTIRWRYLELLEVLGKLTERPLRNYLSANQAALP
jgi:hypothetical protein